MTVRDSQFADYAPYMRRCLQLAAKGLGRVRPNPLVGCVVVNDGEVVAEGYHRQYGGWHAERNALLSVPPEHRHRLEGATLYVNLEPCSHHGLTPPCADLVVACGIRKVVCCNDDPNPLVAGRGFDRLRQAGIEVVRHVLEVEGRWLNRRFFTFMEQHRPYIILKWAQSSDGFMAPATPGRYWISSPYQTLLSHKWRTEEAAILVGSQTYLSDHPQLTARLWKGTDPQPIVLDRRHRLETVPPHWLQLDSPTPQDLVAYLYEQKVQSLIVEGGRHILDAFIAADLYDEVRIFCGNAPLYAGLPAPTSALLRNVKYVNC